MKKRLIVLYENVKKLLYLLLPLPMYLRIIYFIRYGKILHLKNPIRFSEKIFCLKLINGYEFSHILKRCYDKYTVREYIIEKLGEGKGAAILNEVYNVYEKVSDIDFDELPEKFALKISQSSGYNVICPDIKHFDKEKAYTNLQKWMNDTQNHFPDEEEYSRTSNPKIICEKYLQNANGLVPDDIRVYCFNGDPKLFVVDVGTTEPDGSHGHHIKRNVYDLDWNLLNIDLGRPHDSSIKQDKPNNLDEIICIAKRLSEDFYFARVDLYNIDNKEIKFGEITWIPMGGICIIKPDDFDYEFGSWLRIPEVDFSRIKKYKRGE